MFFEVRGCKVQLVDDQKICFYNTCLIGQVSIHQGLSVSSVSNRLLNQEMSIEKGIMCSYTLIIYAEGYIAFVFPFVHWSVPLFIRSFIRYFPSR